MYSSFDGVALEDFGEATRFDFDEPDASGSIDFGSLTGSLLGFGSDEGSPDGSLDGLGSDDGSLEGSLDGLGSDDGSLEGSLDGLGSGSLLDLGSAATSLAGSEATSLVGSGSPSSLRSGNFLHSAVNFFGLHPSPTHEVPFTTRAISISFCSFKILQ